MNDKKAFLLSQLPFEATEHFNYYFLALDLNEFPELQNLISMQGKLFSVTTNVKVQLTKEKDISLYQKRRESGISTFVTIASKKLSFLAKDSDELQPINLAKDLYLDLKIWLGRDFEQLNLLSNKADFSEFIRQGYPKPLK